MSVLIFVREALPPSNGLLSNNGGWEWGTQHISRLRVKRFLAMAKALEVSFNRKFLSSPSSHLA